MPVSQLTRLQVFNTKDQMRPVMATSRIWPRGTVQRVAAQLGLRCAKEYRGLAVSEPIVETFSFYFENRRAQPRR
jgi:hypothetical protein